MAVAAASALRKGSILKGEMRRVIALVLRLRTSVLYCRLQLLPISPIFLPLRSKRTHRHWETEKKTTKVATTITILSRTAVVSRRQRCLC